MCARLHASLSWVVVLVLVGKQPFFSFFEATAE